MENMTSPGIEETKLQADRQFLIACVFIGGFFVSLGIGFYYFALTTNMTILTFVGTLFGGWVGSIIGYYFGQRPVEQRTRELVEERRRVQDLTEYLKKRSDEMWERLEKKVG